MLFITAVLPDVTRRLIQNHAEYTHESSVRVSVGTWNVNGGKHFRSIAYKHEHITDWLLDLPKITAEATPRKSGSDTSICY